MFRDCELCMLSYLSIWLVCRNCVLFGYINHALCVVVFYLRYRARVAPPVDEAEDEGSFQDEFYPQRCQLGVGVEVKLEVDLV